jgi:5-methylthioadenosine/S-adenosylhomocysteine deaminase
MEKLLIIENTTVITMDGPNHIIENASIVINGKQIVKITAADDVRSKYPQAQFIDGKGKLALPGLINSHTHVAMSLQKGVTLMMDDGLYRIMWPVEKNLTSEDVYIGALAGAAETLKAGSTTIVDHYFFADEIAKATTEIGVRGVLGHTIMSYHGPIIGEREFNAGIAFVDEWQDRHPLVTPWLAPHATDTVSKAWLIKLREIASEKNVGLHLHLAQTQKEQNYINDEYGMGCVEYLDEIGFLGPDVIAAHSIFITESEMDLLAESKAHPVYCPMGHSLNARPARAWDMLKRGVKVLIATDCVTSNNVMDLLGELKMAGAAQKMLTGDTTAMPALKILEMVTVDAAEAIGMGDRLGRIKPGYLADIILVDFHNLSTAPNYSYLDNLIYCCNGRDVHTVIVNGEIVVQDHKLTTMDEDALTDEIEARGQLLINKAIQGDAELEKDLRRVHSP